MDNKDVTQPDTEVRDSSIDELVDTTGSVVSTIDTAQDTTVATTDDEQDLLLDITYEPMASNVSEATPIDMEDYADDARVQTHIFLPAADVEHTKKVVSVLPKMDLSKSASDQRWLYATEQSEEIHAPFSAYSTRINASKASWTNTPTFNGQKLVMAAPSFNSNNGASVSGERAVMRVRSLLGMGTTNTFPLWNSGFWVTVKAPEDTAWMNLIRRIGEAKIDLGHNTTGIVLSNHTVMTNMIVIDFFIEHVVDVSIKDDKIDLRDRILATDIDTILLALASLQYRRGFNYARACMANPQKCKHVIRRRAKAGSSLLYIDWNSIDQKQLAHMSSRGGSSMTPDSVDTYVNSFVGSKEKHVELVPGVTMVLGVPTLNQYFTAGQKWVNGIVKMIDSVFTDHDNEARRNEFITESSAATVLRQHAHWVKAIIVDEVRQEDRDTIDGIIDSFSSIDDVRQKFTTAVLEYLEDATVSVVGIPMMICPSCGAEHGTEAKRFPKVIPINTAETFFTLAAQYINEIPKRVLFTPVGQ